MSFFPDDRAAELRELFFESADELLQQLNELGLQLEKTPRDSEIIRGVRRVVHTLKGDSAACGFRELSALAHELEDALNPHAAAEMEHAIVDVIFTAADTFREMLSAYRAEVQPSPGNELREQIRRITQSLSSPARPQVAESAPRFDWSESQRAQIEQTLERGERVFNIALEFDPASGMRSAAFHMARSVLQGLGEILALHPSDAAIAADASRMEAALATSHSREVLLNKCRIPSVIASVTAGEVFSVSEPAQDLLDVVLQAEARASGAVSADTATHGHQIAAAPDPNAPRERISTQQELQARTLRVDTERIDTVLNLIGELIIGKSMLHRTIVEFDKRYAKDPLRSRFADALAIQSRVLEELQRSVMKIRMVPVEQLFRRFPRIARDVAKSCGRDVAVQISGETTDLDKGILDALAEPLAHIVRNAVNHGIESPQERRALGKAKVGAIHLNAYHQGNQMVIEVSDDGRGIDVQKVLRRAIDAGAISAVDAEKLSNAEAMRLIFLPGLSTADKITETSGRGVGMDVVASAVERLKGTVEIESTPNAGTKFRLMVPLTLASIQALLFRIGGKLYAAPLSNVIEIARVSDSDLHHVDNRVVLRLRDQLLTVISLQTPGPRAAAKKLFVIVIGAGERRFGLIVDSLVGEEELVIKTLDDPLAASDIVSGASILGDGTVVLILNIVAVANQIGRAPALGAIA